MVSRFLLQGLGFRFPSLTVVATQSCRAQSTIIIRNRHCEQNNLISLKNNCEKSLGMAPAWTRFLPAQKYRCMSQRLNLKRTRCTNIGLTKSQEVLRI